jgi:heat-inducible transcriptional repressor
MVADRPWSTLVTLLDADLTDRESRVLQALVDAHIASGEPIGSKVLADQAGLSVSPQTVRNVLAALSERGLIAQPHTSAGRVPTDLGLRYYVDTLMRFSPPAPQVQGEIAARLEEAGGVDQALKEASRLLARLSRQACVVLAPAPAADRVAHVDILRLRDDALLFIAVSTEGRVQNRLVEWTSPPAPPLATLESTSARLTTLLAGRTLAEGQGLIGTALGDTRHALSAVENELLRLSQTSLLALVPGTPLHVDGTRHLLDDIDDGDARRRQRELVTLLEEQQLVRDLLDAAASAPGLRVFIGAENENSALFGASVVTAPVAARHAVGVLGVIGPRHLDYSRVVPLVDVTAAVLSRLLGG